MCEIMRRTVYACLLTLIATAGFAQMSQQQQQQQPGVQTGMQQMRTGVELAQGKQLIGLEVRDQQNQKIGDVADIVLNSRHDQIEYVALSHGGWAGLGGETIAIPWSDFQVHSQAQIEQPQGAQPQTQGAQTATYSKADYLVLNASKGVVDKVKGFNEDRWPTRANQNWRQQTTEVEEVQERSEAEKAQFNTRRLSKLFGTNVSMSQTAATTPTQQMGTQPGQQQQQAVRQGERIGALKDAIINSTNGRVAYGIVTLAKIQNHENDLSSVPWSALQFQSQPELHALLQVPSQQTLLSFAFPEDQESQQLSRLAQSSYSRRIYTAYNQGPQWEALGFVGAGQEQPGFEQREQMRDQREQQREQMRDLREQQRDQMRDQREQQRQQQQQRDQQQSPSRPY